MIDQFQVTTALRKIKKLKKRIRVIPGGTSASKTYSVIPMLITIAATYPMQEISIVAESVPNLRRGAIKDFLKIMKGTNRYVDSHWSRTLLCYTFSNGSYIEFFGADQADKVRGPRRHWLFINECNNVPFDTYHQLAIRTQRGVYLDFNPTHSFWAHEELSDDPDAEWLTLTYKDNEALSESIVKEIEKARVKAKTSAYWDNWWKVYGLGQLGSLEGVILTDWKQTRAIHKDAKYVGSGMDFGYTNDPTALIDVYELNGTPIFDEVLFQTGLTSSQIAKFCGDIERGYMGENSSKRRIAADQADPRLIDEISAHGIHIFGAKKGQDSIRFGLDLLQQKPFLVTQRSTNLIKELRSYMWATNKEGKTLNKPMDVFNHGIDAMRYWAIENMRVGQKMDIR